MIITINYDEIKLLSWETFSISKSLNFKEKLQKTEDVLGPVRNLWEDTKILPTQIMAEKPE